MNPAPPAMNNFRIERLPSVEVLGVRCSVFGSAVAQHRTPSTEHRTPNAQRLNERYLTVIPQQQAEGGGTMLASGHLHVAADQAVLDARAGAHDLAVVQNDAVLDLAVDDLHAVTDAGIGPHEGV